MIPFVGDDVFKPKLNGKKKCPKCHGTGRNNIMISAIYIPDRYPHKKPSNPMMCPICNGTGEVPIMTPIYMGN